MHWNTIRASWGKPAAAGKHPHHNLQSERYCGRRARTLQCKGGLEITVWTQREALCCFLFPIQWLCLLSDWGVKRCGQRFAISAPAVALVTVILHQLFCDTVQRQGQLQVLPGVKALPSSLPCKTHLQHGTTVRSSPSNHELVNANRIEQYSQNGCGVPFPP